VLFSYSLEFSHFVKSSLFISLCILRDLHQQKIPRELCGGGKLKNTRKKGTDQENSKKKDGKNG